MNGAIVLMMVAGSLGMFQLMRHRVVVTGRQPSALHGKAMQGQKQQQENSQKSAHGNRPAKMSVDYSNEALIHKRLIGLVEIGYAFYHPVDAQTRMIVIKALHQLDAKTANRHRKQSETNNRDNSANS